MTGTRRPTWIRRVAVAMAAATWMAFWFWAFSFAYSDSFFLYNPHSRLPTFAAAWLAAGGILASGYVQWRSRRSILGACALHVAGVVVALVPLIAVSSVLAHAPRPWHISGDDAMGVGIDFMILVGVGTVSLVGLAIGLVVRKVVGSKLGAGERGG